ncbi:MAG TPA: AsmA-like C-terminal region-containing protein [Pseudorhodoplanes sp.]|nr:AsmA-like C-terminal region-containing protein [Pseudorhodoplanes sp.]
MTDKDPHSRIAALRALEASFKVQRGAHFLTEGAGTAHAGHAAEADPAHNHHSYQPAACRDGPRAGPRRRSLAGWPPALAVPRALADFAATLRRSMYSFAGLAGLRDFLAARRRGIVKLLYSVAVSLGAVTVCFAALWWRLGSGPVEIDMVTPWLASAIEENFGGRHRVEVGGTQIERDESGHTSLRIRDILVRDADGAIVASAPKAEVAVSTTSLLTGTLRASRVSLVGAELAIRIEEDGQVTISTGAERRPLAVTPAIAKPVAAGVPVVPGAPRANPAAEAAGPVLTGAEKFTELLAWIDHISANGGEDQGLGEIGLKNGTLTVDDLRTGKQWTFPEINFSVNRSRRGGVVFSLGSESAEHPWQLTAAVTPSGYHKRMLQIEARRVLAKDVLLALRLDEGQFQADVPLSGSLRAEIGPDLLPQVIEGRVVAESGMIGNVDEPESAFRIDKAEFTIDWDAMRRSLVVPFQIVSGSNRITLLSQFDAPRGDGAPWRVTVTGGSLVLTAGQRENEPLVLNRIMVRAHLDPRAKRLQIDQGEIGGKDLSLALSGQLDYSGTEPRLAGGLAGTQMTGLSAKRIWPAFVAPTVRNWVLEHFDNGTVERLVIAANAPAETLKESGPPIPDDGLSVEVVVTNGTIRPIDSLPAIREADITTRITGRTATVSVGRGTVELPSGRKLTLTNGLFEVPDTFPKGPPAKVRFRVDGPVQAAAELMEMEPLRDAAGTQLDPATSRGTVSGQVVLGLALSKRAPEGSTSYTITLDLTNFGADKVMMGQKLEAQSLRVIANNFGHQIKGDVKLNGTPASLDYRRANGDSEADVRLTATLDDAARARLGLDTAGLLSGPVPVKLSGRLSDNKEGRVTVEADLTQARIDNLLPNWVKPAGKPARAVFTLASTAGRNSKRFDDIAIDGSGTQVKGSIELSDDGDLLLASFPVFSTSEGDKTSLRAERGPDGTLNVTIRGDLFDGRGFVKSILGTGAGDSKPKRSMDDVDLDVRLGAVVGFNGEALRGVDLKMSRRGGTIRNLSLNSKIGRDAPLVADMRGRNDQRTSKQVLYLETADAGALFRFTDMYPRMAGGQMWVALDPPTKDQAPQEGIVNIRDFSVKGEAALDRIASQNQNNPRSNGVEFSRLRVEFTRAPGRVSFRDGVVRGPTVGATMDGTIDYAHNDVHMRGTFVPLYGLNNAFGQIPIVGLFLGGSNEGLLGVTYEVVGPPGSPTLRVNPISAVAPGLLRKFFEFPGERAPDRGSNAVRSDRPQ